MIAFAQMHYYVAAHTGSHYTSFPRAHCLPTILYYMQSNLLRAAWQKKNTAKAAVIACALTPCVFLYTVYYTKLLYSRALLAKVEPCGM